MNDENLYINVKNKICGQIYKGIYRDGERIPAERVLAETLNVSRVTLRKALELLEEEHLIVKEVGSGTRICLHNYGVPGEVDMVVLIAPAKNPFFSGFIAHFQAYAEEHDAMLLYVEKPQGETLENCLYRLYRKGLSNAAVWLEDLPVDIEKLKRLRALGMNLVFFDTDKGFPYADCVALDNEKAIQSMYQVLKQKGFSNIGYAGWDRADIYSIYKREEAYIKISGSQNIFLRTPWEYKQNCEQYVFGYLKKNIDRLPQAILCGDRDNGTAVTNGLHRLKRTDIQVAAIDDFPEAKKREVIVYTQDLEASAKRIFECLIEQSKQKELWEAEIYEIAGILKHTQLGS